MKFEMLVEEIRVKMVSVEAENQQEACEEINRQLWEDEIVFEVEDFHSCAIQDVHIIKEEEDNAQV